MIKTNTHFVTPEHGPRPAGKPTECFYCLRTLGAEHAADCVMRSRTVVLRYTYEVVVDVPEHWTKDDIEFRRNESTWCADNSISELEELTTERSADGCCLCNSFVRADYLREADEQDDARLKSEFVRHAEWLARDKREEELERVYDACTCQPKTLERPATKLSDES